MKYFRHITSVLTIVLIVVLAAGTVIEKLHGSEYALAHVYGTWWFVGLWALIAACIVIMLIKHKGDAKHCVSTIGKWSAALHLSILFILLGALLTMLTGQHGKMKLEPNRPNNHFFIIFSVLLFKLYPHHFYHAHACCNPCRHRSCLS